MSPSITGPDGLRMDATHRVMDVVEYILFDSGGGDPPGICLSLCLHDRYL